MSAISASLSESIERMSTSRGLLRWRKVGQRINCALQDMRRSQRIDLLGAPGAADVGLDHRSLYRLRGPALIPQEEGQIERREVAGKGADRLRARAVASVHAERQADDQPGDVLALDESAQRFEILGELDPPDGFGGTREMPPGVADGEADGLGADVQSDKLARTRKRGRELARVGGDQRCHAASLLVASRRTAPQNRA